MEHRLAHIEFVGRAVHAAITGVDSEVSQGLHSDSLHAGFAIDDLLRLVAARALQDTAAYNPDDAQNDSD